MDKRIKNDLGLESEPPEYCYWNHFIEHIGSLNKIFDGSLVYPRQIEIHLPGDGINACNFHCFYCSGKAFTKELGSWEEKGLQLMRDLDGRIPYHIHAGSHTEPTMNAYLLDYLKVAKETGCNFGIHTNGSLLWRLEKEKGFLTQLCEIAEDKIDYLSISLDAGSTESHCKTKGLNYDWFSEILEGIRCATKLNDKMGDKIAIRICYLMNEYNSSQKEIDSIVDFAREVKVDSLRFSMPVAYYTQDFEKVRDYKRTFRIPNEGVYYDRVSKYLTDERMPHIFWASPKLWDVDLLDFKQCAYGYYQICIGADGYFYRCSTVSSSSFKHLRLGPVSDKLEEFNQIVRANQDASFDTASCFHKGARCNRMGTGINRRWRDLNER